MLWLNVEVDLSGASYVEELPQIEWPSAGPVLHDGHLQPILHLDQAPDIVGHEVTELCEENVEASAEARMAVLPYGNI